MRAVIEAYNKLNGTGKFLLHVLESLLAAGIIGIVVMYGVTTKIQTTVEIICQDINEIRQDMKDVKTDVTNSNKNFEQHRLEEARILAEQQALLRHHLQGGK